MTNKRTFAQRLRKFREIRRLSQSELAARCKMKPSAISHFETGRREPSMVNLRKLAECLRISASILIGQKNPDVHNLYDVLETDDLEFIDLVRTAIIDRHRKRIRERKRIEEAAR